MIEAAVTSTSLDSLEDILRDDLAHCDAMTSTVVPILRHLLLSDGNSVFTDEILARVRGMVGDIAVQLLDEMQGAQSGRDSIAHDQSDIAGLSDRLIANSAFLRHVHALALEGLLAGSLQARLSLDPVLSPLMQALIASSDSDTAALAMRMLASQARFCQSQRRMKLPLGELPGDLLHGALEAMLAHAGEDQDAQAKALAAESAIRIRYDEGLTRLGMAAQLVTGMGGGAIAALSVTHAGVAIFISALAIGSGLDRDETVLATNEAQLARLALSLRAAGMKPEGVAEQFLALHPDIELPEGFEMIGADRAAAILAISGSCPGD
ncbi:MAG: hypothetical protein KDE55_21195 [Novosphingobium sp.]|nr:hypothetical protein [Novosphingobium sp.]